MLSWEVWENGKSANKTFTKSANKNQKKKELFFVWGARNSSAYSEDTEHSRSKTAQKKTDSGERKKKF